ncbi:hypothetical protein JW848_10465 [Candidatus Bipolaricaulota bacterium]|nr:hypothetical protein [Candidatus Bipolaricaulota bacterium]
MEDDIRHRIREQTVFAGIRQPLASRDELAPRIDTVRRVCAGVAAGPLTHIIRFDTPVDGLDSEIGYPVPGEIESDEVTSHTLRRLDFFSALHTGPVATLGETRKRLYEQMQHSGLSPELELVEIYHHYDPENESENRIEVQASFLAWPEVYRTQLVRGLGEEAAAAIWRGGERITPFTVVDERVAWVADTIARLKEHATPDQQFDILSRVALVRPQEDMAHAKKLFESSGRDASALLEEQSAALAAGPAGGTIDPWWIDDKALHLSKVAVNRAAYDKATTHDEQRRGYCFCSLIREAANPEVDPIFCYRAAGWARQFWEPILGVRFKHCTITHSILKGDPFCAWDYDLTDVGEHPS